jgi:hypothetical protein
MAMARRLVARAAASAGRSARSSRARMCSSSAAEASATASGPPFLRYFVYTTGIMFGIPGAVGAVFVYNLRSDDEFYAHFNERYPDMIAAIEEYVTLDASAVALASREDVGDVEAPDALQHETVTVAVELASRRRVRFRASGSASREEIVATALRHSETPDADRVLSVSIDDEGEELEQDVVVEDMTTPAALTTQQAWPPAPRTSWGGKQPTQGPTQQPKQKPAKAAQKTPEAELRREIAAIVEEQAALEASKFAGRDVDDADEEIARLEARKQALEAALPRKRFLWIF